jgi:hypothetical protein
MRNHRVMDLKQRKKQNPKEMRLFIPNLFYQFQETLGANSCANFDVVDHFFFVSLRYAPFTIPEQKKLTRRKAARKCLVELGQEGMKFVILMAVSLKVAGPKLCQSQCYRHLCRGILRTKNKQGNNSKSCDLSNPGNDTLSTQQPFKFPFLTFLFIFPFILITWYYVEREVI